MNGTAYFNRLVASAERIARHAECPGKQQALGQCIEDIVDLVLAEQITAEQGERIRSVLRGALSHAASTRSTSRRFRGKRPSDQRAGTDVFEKAAVPADFR